jgi:hypothetical protein
VRRHGELRSPPSQPLDDAGLGVPAALSVPGSPRVRCTSRSAADQALSELDGLVRWQGARRAERPVYVRFTAGRSRPRSPDGRCSRHPDPSPGGERGAPASSTCPATSCRAWR